jgi:phosphate transport system substrate-binding protein
MVPLVTELAERFKERHPHARIDIEPTTTDRILGDTRQGLADLGFLGRALRPDETGVQGTVLGRDGIAFVVHRDNPVHRLNESLLVGLLSRVYTNWKDVGGSDRPVVVVGVGEGRALRDVLLDQFALRTGQLRPDPALGSSEQVLQAVANQPAALGYVSLGAAEAFAAQHPVRLLPYHDVPATLENVRNRTYTLVRNLLVLTRENPAGVTGEFLDYARSEEAQALMGKFGFVPASP